MFGQPVRPGPDLTRWQTIGGQYAAEWPRPNGLPVPQPFSVAAGSRGGARGSLGLDFGVVRARSPIRRRSSSSRASRSGESAIALSGEPSGAPLV